MLAVDLASVTNGIAGMQQGAARLPQHEHQVALALQARPAGSASARAERAFENSMYQSQNSLHTNAVQLAGDLAELDTSS